MVEDIGSDGPRFLGDKVRIQPGGLDAVVSGPGNDDARQLVADVDGGHGGVAMARVHQQGTADFEVPGAMLGDESGKKGDEQVEVLIGQVEAARVVSVDEPEVRIGRAVMVGDDFGHTGSVSKEPLGPPVAVQIGDRAGANLPVYSWPMTSNLREDVNRPGVHGHLWAVG